MPKVKPVASQSRHWIALSSQKPLLYRKEVIYEGDWKKLNSDGDGIEFESYLDSLNHWKESIDAQLADGIEIPLSTSHDEWTESANKLGDVVGARVAKNKKGKHALFVDVKFANEKKREIGIHSNVSIGSPEVWRYDGRGKKWHFPVTHVASTTAPVIPGLGTWQAIAAAFGKSKKGKAMELDDLIAAMGIEVDEAVDTDDGKKALVLAWIKEKGGGAAAPAEEEAVEAANTAPVKTKPAEGDDEEEDRDDKTGKGKARKVTATVAFSQRPEAPLMIKTVHGARMAQLDALVEQKVITPAVKKELVLAHCTSEQITLELSQGSDGKQFDDAIKLVKIMAKDRPLRDSGRSEWDGNDDDATITLSHENGKDQYSKFVEERYAKK